jgi:hypothetical protein
MPVHEIAIAIVNPLSPVSVDRDRARGDVNGDGASEEFSSCSDGKTVMLEAWTGAPYTGEHRWNRTVHPLFEVRKTCKIDFPSAALLSAMADSARKAAISVGAEATALFTHDGNPVDARCLVGLESLPVNASACTGDTRTATNTYSVLATKWRRFLIASDGPNGSALQWVRYADGRIAMESTVLSGAGCDGRQSGFRIDADSVVFKVDMAAPEILARAGLVLTAVARGQFSSPARQSTTSAACPGIAELRYSIDGEGMRLASLTLSGATLTQISASDSARAPLQHCFDLQAREWVERQAAVLNPVRLAQFGRAFVARCMTAPEFNQVTTVEGAWSPVVDGLRGRLVLTGASDSLKRAKLQISLDLENVRNDSTSIGIWLLHGLNNRVVPLTLVDESGQEVPRLVPAGSETNGPLLRWIPARETVRIAFWGGYEYVTARSRILLRPSTFVAWDITSLRNQLYLRGAVTPYVSPDSSQRGWAGTLQLPLVALPPR